MALLFLILLLSTIFTSGGVDGTNFRIVNNCYHTVWPGIRSSGGVTSLLPATGFSLQTGEATTLTTTNLWVGQIWGRTLCRQGASGNFSCVTGDCGSGKLECSGRGSTAAKTLAEFSLGGSGGQDYFHVSLVDGFNLPMVVATERGNCTRSTAGCVVDLNGACPPELKVLSESGVVGCRSACAAFQEPRYCCTGAYSLPSSCNATSYSLLFKKACPHAVSYVYDDRNTTFTCRSSDYLITFCPTPISNITSNTTESAPPPPAQSTSNVPHTDTSIVYRGGAPPSEESGASPSTSNALCFISLTMAFWRFCHIF